MEESLCSHMRDTFKSQETEKLSGEEKKESTSFRIWGRACADRRKQKEYIDNDDTASQRVYQDSIFIMAAMKAHKN